MLHTMKDLAEAQADEFRRRGKDGLAFAAKDYAERAEYLLESSSAGWQSEARGLRRKVRQLNHWLPPRWYYST